MNRFFSTLIILAMGLIALAIWIRQTLENGTTTGLIFAQGLAVIVIVVFAGSLIRGKLTRYRTQSKRSRFEFLQPLRRLFSAVWS